MEHLIGYKKWYNKKLEELNREYRDKIIPALNEFMKRPMEICHQINNIFESYYEGNGEYIVNIDTESYDIIHFVNGEQEEEFEISDEGSADGIIGEINNMFLTIHIMENGRPISVPNDIVKRILSEFSEDLELDLEFNRSNTRSGGITWSGKCRFKFKFN